MINQELDAGNIFKNWNAPKAKATTDPDAEAQAAVEQTGDEPDDTATDLLTGDPGEPFNIGAVYNKWNGRGQARG